MSREALDLLDLAALEAAEGGDAAAVAALRPSLSFTTMLECLNLLAPHRDWKAPARLMLHLLLILEVDEGPGIKVELDWSKIFGPGGMGTDLSHVKV